MSIEELKQVLSYDQDTGKFTWTDKAARVSMRNKKAGATDARGCVYIKINKKSFMAHRLAWLFVYGEFPNGIIDHINGNPSDNRICNLRDVSHAVNLQNQTKPMSNNKNGYLGVSPTGNKWQSQITVNKKKLHLGTFEKPELAHAAYLIAKRKFHEGCTL